MAFDRPLGGLDPKEHVGTGGITALAGERVRKIGQRVAGLRRPERHAAGSPSSGPLLQSRRESIQLTDQFGRRHEVRAPIVRQRHQRFAAEIETVGGTGNQRGRFLGCLRHAAQAFASAIRWPARLPLSTEET